MGRSGTTQDLERIKSFLDDVSRALRNHPDGTLNRLGRDADDYERKMRDIISTVRRNWKED